MGFPVHQGRQLPPRYCRPCLLYCTAGGFSSRSGETQLFSSGKVFVQLRERCAVALTKPIVSGGNEIARPKPAFLARDSAVRAVMLARHAVVAVLISRRLDECKAPPARACHTREVPIGMDEHGAVIMVIGAVRRDNESARSVARIERQVS